MKKRIYFISIVLLVVLCILILLILKNRNINNVVSTDINNDFHIDEIDTSNYKYTKYVIYVHDKEEYNLYDLDTSDSIKEDENYFLLKTESNEIILLENDDVNLSEKRYLPYIDNKKIKIYDIKNNKYYLIDLNIDNIRYEKLVYDDNYLYGMVFSYKTTHGGPIDYSVYSFNSKKIYDGNNFIHSHISDFLVLKNDIKISLYSVFEDKIYNTILNKDEYEIIDTHTIEMNHNKLIGLSVRKKNTKEDEINNKSFYSIKDSKILVDSYNAIQRLSEMYIALGKIVNYSEESETYSFQIDILNLENKKIKNFDLLKYNIDNCGDEIDVLIDNRMFESNLDYASSKNYYIYNPNGVFDSEYGICFDKKSITTLYDENFNKIDENFHQYYLYNDYAIVYKDPEGLSVYKSNNRLVKNLNYEGKFIDFLDNYLVFQINSEIKLLSYDNLISGVNNLIDTGVKLEKNDTITFIDEDNDEIELRVNINGKTLKEKKKICELKPPYEYSEPLSDNTNIDIYYKYSLKDKSLNNEINCYN